MSDNFDWKKVLAEDEAAEGQDEDLEALLSNLEGADEPAAEEPAPEEEPAPAEAPPEVPPAVEEPAAVAASPEQQAADAGIAVPGDSENTIDFPTAAAQLEDGVDADGNYDQKQFMPAAVPKDVIDPRSNTSKFKVEKDEEALPEIAEHGDEDLEDPNDVHLDRLLHEAVERRASDIHITAGLPPMIRVDGDLEPLPYKALKAEQTRRICYDALIEGHIERFEKDHELDFGYTVKDLARFRFNLYMQRGAVAGALRMIPNKIPSFESLNLPSVIRELSKRHSGIVLVTGPTGSGKSTTIAAMIDDINESRNAHIMTIEDPIEYVHKHKRCMVNQRELHSDTYTFHNALRAVLREDPDIILVGELRDLETIEAALTLAETGHLVFGTLHTRNAPSTIDRIVDVFPSDQQDQIRVLLGNTLEGVISQQLLPQLGGGRCASLEIMLGVPSIKNLIREGKTHQMYSIIETSAAMGMETMDKSLAKLFRQGTVSFEECLHRSVDKETFSRLAKGAA